MKIVRPSILFLVLGIICSTQCVAAEFRGAWVTSWSRGFFTADEIDKTIADAQTAGLNALVIEVRKAGDAYYQSSIEPVGPQVPAGFDPLEYCIKQAHAKGIRVCAWLVVYRVWKGTKPPADPKHVLNQHPDWRSLTFDGKNEAAEGVFIDPGIPEYRDYFAGVCEDIVKRYAVDAIHYDYVRYPGPEWGYSDIALKRYYSETGATEKPKIDDPKWLQWRRDQVTAMVTVVRDRVKAVNPDVKIQASTIPWGDCPEDFTQASPYTQACQDWRLWMEKGLIDENCPMVYAKESDPKGAAHYRGWVDGAKRWSYGRTVYVGTSAGRSTPEDILKQIDAVRKAGLAGFMLFSFNQSNGRPDRAAALGKGLYPAPMLRVIQANGNDAMAARKALAVGMALASKNKLGPAIVDLTKAATLDPGCAQAFFNIGRCYVRSKNPVKACEFFEKALVADPGFYGAKEEVAKLKGSL